MKKLLRFAITAEVAAEVARDHAETAANAAADIARGPNRSLIRDDFQLARVMIAEATARTAYQIAAEATTEARAEAAEVAETANAANVIRTARAYVTRAEAATDSALRERKRATAKLARVLEATDIPE